MPPAVSSQQTLIDYLLSDARILAWVGWGGLIIGVVSLVVTIFGFAIAVIQIRRVKLASEAARDATVCMAAQVRSKEQSAKIVFALGQVNNATTHITGDNAGAAVAHLLTSCNAVIEARALSFDEKDQATYDECIYANRKIIENLPIKAGVSIDEKKQKFYVQSLRKIASNLDEMSVRLRYEFVTHGEVR